MECRSHEGRRCYVRAAAETAGAAFTAGICPVSPRKVTDEERDLFKQQFEETRPLAPIRTVDEVRALVTQKRKKGGEDVLPGGVDGRTEERLRRGQVEPEARLDLHGFTENAAHDTLLNFLRGAQQ